MILTYFRKWLNKAKLELQKKFHELNLKQTKSPLVWICVLVLFMGSWLEMKGLDPALMLTFTTIAVPRILNQAVSVEGQYLLSCQTEIQTPKDRVPHPQHYWEFALDNFPFVRGAVLCIVGCLAASLNSVHELQVGLLSPVITSKSVPRCCQISWGRGAKSPPVENHCSSRQCCFKNAVVSIVLIESISSRYWKEKQYIYLPRRII